MERLTRWSSVALLALLPGCLSTEPAPGRWIDADALAGSVTLTGDVWGPSWVVGRTWLEVRGPEFRVEVRADADGVWSLAGWPADASPLRVLAFSGEYPRPRAEGRSVLVDLDGESTQVRVPTIRVRERVGTGGSLCGGARW